MFVFSPLITVELGPKRTINLPWFAPTTQLATILAKQFWHKTLTTPLKTAGSIQFLRSGTK